MKRPPTEREREREAFVKALVTARPDLYDAMCAYEAYTRRGGYFSMFRAGIAFERSRAKRKGRK